MTLNSRNKILLIGCIGMAVLQVSLLLYGIVLTVTGNLEPFPGDYVLDGSIFSFFFDKNYLAGSISVSLLSLYTSITFFLLYWRFEKTIAPEIMYFACFLIGAFLESFRLLIPLFNLWVGLRPVLVYIGRISFAGRLLTLFSLLFTSFPITEDFMQDTDKNIAIGFCVAILFASVVPQNTHVILPSVMVPYTFTRLFITVRILLYITAIVTIVCTNRFPRFYGLLVTYAGYLLLSVSATYFMMLLGVVFLVGGSTLFLIKLHQFYLWK